MTSPSRYTGAFVICFTMVVVGSNHYFMTGVLLDSTD